MYDNLSFINQNSGNHKTINFRNNLCISKEKGFTILYPY